MTGKPHDFDMLRVRCFAIFRPAHENQTYPYIHIPYIFAAYLAMFDNVIETIAQAGKGNALPIDQCTELTHNYPPRNNFFSKRLCPITAQKEPHLYCTF